MSTENQQSRAAASSPAKRQRLVSSKNSNHGNWNSSKNGKNSRLVTNFIGRVDKNSTTAIFYFIQPSLLFKNIVRVCKQWNKLISNDNFIFGYYKQTCHLTLPTHYSKELLRKWKVAQFFNETNLNSVKFLHFLQIQRK